MEKTLKILDYEDKKGKDSGKRYTRFQTNEGWMSAFEKDVINHLKNHEGKDCVVCETKSVEKDGKTFHNIRGFVGVGDPKNLAIPEESASSPPTQRGETKQDKGTSFYTAYAKDICIALLNREDFEIAKENAAEFAMTESIKLVKLAREAFQ